MRKRLTGKKIRILLCWMLTFFVFGHVHSETRVYFEAGHYAYSVGDTVVVQIKIYDVTDLHGVQTVFRYDSDLFNILSIDEGGLLSQEGPTWFTHSPDNIQAVRDTILVDQAILGPSAATGSGTLYQLTLQALQPGHCVMKLVHVDLRNLVNGSIPAQVDSVTITVGQTAVEGRGTVIPYEFSVTPSYPNPFNASTRMQVSLLKRSLISIDVFDCRGRRVRELVSGMLEPGEHLIEWDGKDDQGAIVASGVYYTRVFAGSTCQIVKMSYSK
jgi:hypothetical protein